MSMDSAVIRALCVELSERFTGAKVKGVVQFDPWEFALRTDRGDLLISCHQRFKRIVQSESAHRPIGTHFARTAEDLLRHSVIARIEQKDLDRIIGIGLEKRDSPSETSAHSMVVELIGSSGNAIILTAMGKVITTFRRSRRNTSGNVYRPPRRPHWLNPASADPAELTNVLAEDEPAPLAERIQKSVMGFGPVLAREAAHMAGLDSEIAVGSLTHEELVRAVEEITTLFAELVEARFCPTVYYRGDDPVEFSCFALSHLHELRMEKFGSMVEAVNQFFSREPEMERVSEKKRLLMRPLRSRIRAARTRVAKQKEDLEKSKDAEEHRLAGDAILANLGQLKKGDSTVALPNPHEPEEMVQVELRPNRTPQEIAQEYFRKYKKMKKAHPLLRKKLAESRARLEDLERLQNELEEAESAERVNDLARILEDRGIVQRAKVKKEKEKKQYRTFVTSGGWEVLVGRSRQENDEITFRIAKPRDLFFHVSSAPGSHTIMRVQGKGSGPSKRDIEEAASIAAYYSKAKTSKLVSVSYTERKYVRKPRKAPPGTVTVERVKTVMVEPRRPNQ